MTELTIAAFDGFAPTSPNRPLARSLAQTIENSRLAQFVALFLYAMLVRAPVFGEWNYDIDDQFYFLVGRRMLHGATLYVDIWDRKGPLLYLIYAAIAWLSSSVVAFQLAATVAAAAGAYGINRLAQLVASPRAGMVAGLGYLSLICFFGGATGQSPVFYNPLMITAAWTIATRIDLLRRGRIDRAIVGGVACASLAIAIKQSAAAEAAFFGVVIAVLLVKSGAPLTRVSAQLLLLAIIAVLPWVVTFGWYADQGHFKEAWQALVGSNLTRMYDSWLGRVERIGILTGQMILPLVFGVLGASSLRRDGKNPAALTFITLWAVVAMLSVLNFPIINSHYALPVLPALCILASGYFVSGLTGPIAFAGMALVALVNGGTLNLVTRYRAHVAGEELVRYVHQETPHGKLLVWGFPSFLYARLDIPPPSVLAFPPHFFQGDESGVSGIDEVHELRRILATRPETVVFQKPILTRPINQPNMTAVVEYVRHCPKVRRIVVYDHNGEQPQLVYSQCYR